MFKTTLLALITLSLAPASLFAAASELHCTGEDVEVTIQFNFTPPINSSIWTRGQVQVAKSDGEQKFCSVFKIERQYYRIGYEQTYEGTLTQGVEIALSERSFTNEGPAESTQGVFTDQNGEQALSCTTK